MPQRLIFLDFETYYDRDYSLSKMPIPNYLLDPRYETLCCGVKEETGPAYCVDGPDFPTWLQQFPPDTTTTVTFNALFDNSILAWRYGYVPHRMLDAMGMARALLGHKLDRFSLAAVAAHLGIGSKGGALPKVISMKRDQIKAHGLWKEFTEYAAQDAALCAGIFDRLIPIFPCSEQKLMDLVLRCAVQPRFQMDQQMLAQHIVDLADSKQKLLDDSGMTIDQLMSADKFKAALEGLGVTVEYKVSPTGRQVPAFAKTDAFMAELQEHPDPRVQALVAARLGHKSTLEETRSIKLLSVAKLPWSVLPGGNAPRLYSGGTMPVPLRYGGAHTHRLSGDWGMNMQNLPSSRSQGSKLRRALIAPPGHKVVVADLAQIEARMVAWIAKEAGLLGQFANKKDPYAIMASRIFDFPVDPKIHKLERFIGKTAILGLGYGCGVDKFDSMVITMARSAGLDLGTRWNDQMARKSVTAYRNAYSKIAGAWRRLDFIISTSWLGKGGPSVFGPVSISKGRVDLPSGLALLYDNPRRDQMNDELIYTYGRFTHKIYGAKMLENIVQALARIVVMNAALRLSDRGYRFVLQAHDELVFIVPDADVDNCKRIVLEEMTRRPSWARDLPLAAEAGSGQSYGDAK